MLHLNILLPMIRGQHYYFFRLDHYMDDPSPDYRIARSVDELIYRFGERYMRSFYKITQLNEVTHEHIRAIDEFLLQQIS